ncbi:MAG: response regulator transcription factor [Gemmatimonadetes bacterium]|nr:response regulator transcription factor [Gemmatimonadota bacterium]
MNRMILIETDDDLAGYVTTFFGAQYKVARLHDLEEALHSLEEDEAYLLLADITSRSSRETALVEEIRARFPNLRIVLTYLAPPKKPAWEACFRKNADLIIRKPYGVIEIDRAIRGLDDRPEAGASGGHA